MVENTLYEKGIIVTVHDKPVSVVFNPTIQVFWHFNLIWHFNSVEIYSF